MTNDEQYVSPQGYTLVCTMVQPDKGAGVWNLTVQMDRWREEKQSAIFYTPSFPDVEPTIQFESATWVDSFWVSQSETIYACDGLGLWRGVPGQFSHQRLSDRMIFKVWGLDDRTIFILGAEGLVLRSAGDGWQDISIPATTRLFDIHGLTPDDVYAVGENGSFWRFDGSSWSQIDTQTNTHLLGVFVDGNDRVYVCGENATCFRYQAGQIVNFNAQSNRVFTSISRLKANIYVGASGRGVDCLVEPDLLPFKPNIFGQRISASSTYLWSCGNNSIYRFDGSAWLKKDFL